MIPNHAQFLTAIQKHKKVWLRFYSTADSGLLDRVCAPLDYGPGDGNPDGLNRYWLCDYTGDAGSHTVGLLPQQIVELRMLGEVFDPAQFIVGLAPASVAPMDGLSPATVASAHGVTIPIL